MCTAPFTGGVRRRPPLAPRDRSLPDDGAFALVEDESYAAQEAAAMLTELAQSLAPFDRALLLRHVRDGETLTRSPDRSG